ncbi:MAG: ABC transporter permease, partial [Candidatus Spyradocola sp.]
MRPLDVVRTALRSLLGNRTRSFLTVLGLSIGVGACIAIGSLGIAAVEEVRGEMNRFGVDRIWIEEKAGNALPMDEDDVRALQSVGQAVAPMRYAALTAKNG